MFGYLDIIFIFTKYFFITKIKSIMPLKLFIKTTLLLIFFSFPLLLRSQSQGQSSTLLVNEEYFCPAILESLRNLNCEYDFETCPLYWARSQYDTLRQFAVSEIKFLGNYQDSTILPNLLVSLHNLTVSMDAIHGKEVLLYYQTPGNEHPVPNDEYAAMAFYVVNNTLYDAITFLNTYYLLKNYAKKHEKK